VDEQFQLVSTGSGFQQVEGSEVYSTLTQTNMPVDKSGYLYIYVSNVTTNIDVFFDNLQVTHVRGPLIEETHYYPFGLTMAGISSKALNFGNPANKKNKFQDQELNDDLGINYYEFKWRNHDYQIGRFIPIDPLSDKYVHNSTFAFSENKVISHIELEGLEAVESTSPRVRALMKDNVQEKMNKATNTLRQAASFELTTGPGVGFTAKAGKFGA
jgi:RHS repeat-associated protein